MSWRIKQRPADGTEMGSIVRGIESVYRRRVGDFHSMVAAILRDQELAHDVVQDAFATAIRQGASFRGTGSLDAWICRIVINTAHSEQRRRFAQTTDDLSSDPRLEARTPECPDENGIQVAMALLPERQRLALFLRYYVDLDYRTIAEVLGVAPGTVSATLHSAHAALRRTFEEVAE
jgi:RNA polymerase sigma factor (sigma-70 family)